MTDFWARLDEVRAANDVLQHPFYVRWTKGELSREELASYAGEYRHAVVAIADATELAAEGDGSERASPSRRRGALARRALGPVRRRCGRRVVRATRSRRPPTALTPGPPATTSLDHLVTLYAIEAAQPAIAKVKRDGLVRLYGDRARPGHRVLRRPRGARPRARGRGPGADRRAARRRR